GPRVHRDGDHLCARRQERPERRFQARRSTFSTRCRSHRGRHRVVKEHPDINDTLRGDGPEAVRGRHDRAQKYSGNGQDERGRKGQRFPLLPSHKLTLRTSAAYLVKGIIPRVGIIAVYGPPKCGKSLWAFDIAMHSALNWRYRERRVISGIVIYCAFEGADGFNARAAAFRQQYSMRPDTEVPF